MHQKLKSGKPSGYTSFPKNYIFNEQYGIFGDKASIDAHIRYWEQESRRSPDLSVKSQSPSRPFERSPIKSTYKEGGQTISTLLTATTGGTLSKPLPAKPSRPEKRGCGSANMTSFDGYDNVRPEIKLVILILVIVSMLL